MKLPDFYRRFAKLPVEKTNIILHDIRYDPMTMMLLYKQLEYVRHMQFYFHHREEELLRIAEETFNQIEK